MNVGLIIYGSLETVSGGYLYDRKLVQTLREQGDRVEIVSLPWRSYVRHLFDNWSPGLLRHLKQSRYDVLLQDELNHPSLFQLNWRLAALRGGKTPYPIVSIVHHLRCSEPRPGWQNSLYRLVERRYLQSVDGFVFNSQTTRATVTAVLKPGPPGTGAPGTGAPGLDSRPWLVAYPAGDQLDPWIEEPAVVMRARQSGPLRLLFVGNLIPRKGLHILLDALVALPPGLCHLEVVGSLTADPSYATRIMQRVSADPRLQSSVQFLGRLDDEHLRSCLSRHQVLVGPSGYEGFGIVYLEAMGFGLPAIGTTAGAAGEIITNGQDGFLVPSADPPALAARLAELATDRSLLQTLSLAARQRYLAHPTWEQTALQIREYLSRLLTNPVQ